MLTPGTVNHFPLGDSRDGSLVHGLTLRLGLHCQAEGQRGRSLCRQNPALPERIQSGWKQVDSKSKAIENNTQINIPHLKDILYDV